MSRSRWSYLFITILLGVGATFYHVVLFGVPSEAQAQQNGQPLGQTSFDVSQSDKPSALALGSPGTPRITRADRDTCYAVEQVRVGDALEYRFTHCGHHFMTLVDENGTFNLRPRPGCDINGWGSSWYAQPFLPGAVLAHTEIEAVIPDAQGVQVSASGGVSQGASGTYGTWGATLSFAYDPTHRIITGTGTTTIALAAPLDDTTGDLNLYRLASNYLHDVPLLSGATGDTGDMSVAEVAGDGFAFTWLPPDQPSHFPTDTTSWLSVDVRGQHNVVDTEAQGYEPIEPAFKPSLKVVLTAQQPEVEMRFGAAYDTTRGQAFWADNVGVTPLIHRDDSPVTVMDFDVLFESQAIERCVYLPLTSSAR